MALDVGRFYLDHLFKTAGPPELYLRAVELAVSECDQQNLARLNRRISLLRRAVALNRAPPEVATAFLQLFSRCRHAARTGNFSEAGDLLHGLRLLCLKARPGMA